MRRPVVLPAANPRGQSEATAPMARHRFKQSDSLQDRLAVFAQDLRDQAALLAPGALKDDLIRRARQAETALHLDDWANSPGLQSPK